MRNSPRLNSGAMLRKVGATIYIGAALFVAVVAALQHLQTDYDPVNQLMSELALGPYGQHLQFAFVGLAVAWVGVATGLRVCQSGLGLVSMATLAGLSFLLAGVFHLGAPEQGGMPGIHIFLVALAFILGGTSMALIPLANGVWRGPALRLLSWVILVGMALSVLLGESVVPMGVAQRSAVGCMLLWLVVNGWLMRRFGRESA